MNSRFNFRLAFAASVIAVFSTFAIPAQAKGLGQMLADTGIEPESLTMMQEQAKALYTSDTKSVGDAREWTNTRTGSKGVVEIVSIKKNCVELEHRFELAGSGETSGANVWRCRAENGDWQLADAP